MKHCRILKSIPLLAVAGAALHPSTASACAACFGKSDSRLALGMNWGILTLLFFIVSMLAVISMFFVFIGRRAAQHPLPEPPDDPDPTPTV